MLTKIFPFLAWFKDYNGTALRTDAIAGLTVALVLIPQSMAYAQLAGLPAYYGLYAAFLPPMIASLFGSSRQLATGPVAVVSLMSAASLEPLATAGGPEFIAYSILLAMIVGIFQFSLGVLRLGLVVNFLSHPVVNGFTNAAAIIIASSQFSKFFGVYVDKAPHHYDTMIRVTQAAMDYTHMPTLAFGVGAVAIMVTLKKINPRIPNVLVAVAVCTLISYYTGFNNDARVPVNAIDLPGLSHSIEEFNHSIAEISKLGDERAVLNKELDVLLKEETGGHGPSLHLVELKNQINLLTAQMDAAKEHSHLLREELRSLKFEAAGEKGSLTFYSHDALPAGITTDGNTWRVKVGNSPLKIDDLLLMGGGAVVGKIPEGLPTFAMPNLTFNSFFKLLPTAIIISLLGFMEAIAIAKAMATKTGQKLDPNQELIGQGLSNILGSIGSSYACSGSFSRSAVNLQAGAISGVSSVITSIVVVITLLFLTPLLYHLPQAVLAAVIMMAVIGLVNTHGFVHAWKAQWYDGAISIITFLVTLAYAPHLDKGIMVGVALSMAVFLYKSMRPVVAKLSLSEDMVLKSAEHYHLQGCRHIAVVRFDGALFFANASYLDEQVIRFRTENPDLRYILLDASGINDMDASGEEALALLVDRMRAAKLGFGISSVKDTVLNVMHRTHLYDKIEKDNFYPDSKTAVDDIIYRIHHNTDLPEEGCNNCPLTQYRPQ
ncbi:MAG: STAS domain-containing protein [Desulfobulbaceae bacterium]|uniref:STAS domain-containing protein n=1 Tax=Candidatus Desulfatifera sulfidica TaxID=2841691 RepID=A0A8J6TE93_9BACT|nr:STAS domain-containing protein [Candidatus Desulfatifera sulfidica]